MADSWARARAHERIGAVMSESPDASSLRLQVLAVLHIAPQKAAMRFSAGGIAQGAGG